MSPQMREAAWYFLWLILFVSILELHKRATR